MTEDQIKHMRDRFLMWKLHPQNHRYEPVGTNLFDATQAEAMVRYIAEGLPPGL